MIASFSRALLSDLRHEQSDEEFDRTLGAAIDEIYEASTDEGAGLTVDERVRSGRLLPPPERTEPAKLYLISPQEVGGGFPDRLKAALERRPVAAFQLRVKDMRRA